MADLTKKSIKDLQKLLVEKREEHRGFRFGIAGSNVRNVKQGRTLRREIAQILTELRTRALETK